MTTREALHRLVDSIADGDLDAAQQVLEQFADPLMQTVANAPFDDEPETDDERVALAEGRAALDAGDAVTLDELRRELGV
jgi:hypothetical protein